MRITRRDCIKGAAATALASGFPLPLRLMAQDAALSTLRESAARCGLRYGSEPGTALADAPAAYQSLFTRQCGLYAPNLWGATINPWQDEFRFEQEQPGIDFARAHGMKLTGAHLLWYMSAPEWLKGLHGRQDMGKAVISLVYAIASRYRGQAFSWNVINEALNPIEGRPDGLRQCEVLKEVGADYFTLAFRAARIADPHALLVWNEYGMELDNADNEARRTALLRFLDTLQNGNTPIDAVGLQSHLKLADFAFDEKKYRAFLGHIASRGLKILITELDVLDVGAPSDVTTRDRKVADVYARFLGTALDEQAVTAVVTWGICDRYTWLTPKYDPRFARSDGLPARPLPFDEGLKPTPAFFAIQNAFDNAPKRVPA